MPMADWCTNIRNGTNQVRPSYDGAGSLTLLVLVHQEMSGPVKPAAKKASRPGVLKRAEALRNVIK